MGDDNPNYKWRVLAGLLTIFMALAAVVLIVRTSFSQSAESIAFLFAMALGVVIIVIMSLFRYPSETKNESGGNSNMVVILTAIIGEVIGGTIAVLVINLLGPT